MSRNFEKLKSSKLCQMEGLGKLLSEVQNMNWLGIFYVLNESVNGCRNFEPIRGLRNGDNYTSYIDALGAVLKLLC